jgi:hypothetical protein
MEMSGQLHARAVLNKGKKPPGYPLDRRLGGPQSRLGRRGEEKILDLQGLELRPARSQSLYRLRYSGSYLHSSGNVKLRFLSTGLFTGKRCVALVREREHCPTP